MKQKGIALLLALSLLFGLLPAAAAASGDNFPIPAGAEVVGEGDLSGSGLHWEVREWLAYVTPQGSAKYDRALVITGSGDMPAERPWRSWAVDFIYIGEGCTSICDGAFGPEVNLRQVVLPGTLKRIGSNAFAHTGLTTIQLPEGLEEIGDGAFADTENLFSLSIPDSVTTLGTEIFSQSAVQTVRFPAGMETLPERTFASSTGLCSVALPAGCTAIGKGAFQYSALRRAVLPDGLRTIGSGAFAGCEQLSYVSLPQGLTDIGEGAFSGCTALEGIQLPGGLTTIGGVAFSGCTALSSVVIPANVTEIGDGAFFNCTGLKQVRFLGEKLTYLGRVFENCTALEQAVIPASVAQMRWTFLNCTGLKSVGFLGEGICNLELLFPGSALEDLNDYRKKQLSDSHKTILPTTAAVYYLEDQPGWTGITYDPYDSCSDTMWFSHPLGIWDGVHLPVPETGDETYGDYYATGGSYFFCFTDPQAGYPSPRDFTLTAGGREYRTGESSDRMTLELGAAPGDVTVSKEGYLSWTMPEELLGSYNWVSMWKDTVTTPVPQGIYMDNSQGAYRKFTNLLTSDCSIYELDESLKRVYVSVDWRGHPEGEIYLVQGEQSVPLTNNGWTELQPGITFQARAGDIYLRLVYGGQTKMLRLQLTIRQPTQKIDTNLGGTGENGGAYAIGGTIPQEKDLLNGMNVKFNLSGENIPISVAWEDGKIQGIVGVSVDLERKRSYLDEVKHLFSDDLNTGGHHGSLFESFRRLCTDEKDLESVWPVRNTNAGFKMETRFLGYFEGAFVEGADGGLHLSITMSKLAIQLKGEVGVAQQFYAGPWPLYWTAKLQGELEAAMLLSPAGTGLGEFTVPPIDMCMMLGLMGEVGVGIPDYVKVGVNADATFNARWQLPLNVEQVYLQGQVYLSWRILWFEGTAGKGSDILTGNFVIYDRNSSPKWFPDDAVINAQGLEEGALVPIARDYLEWPSPFTANDGAVELLEGAGSPGEVLQIMENTFPESQPQLAVLPDGTLLLVWVGDDGTGTLNNHTALWYTRYDGEVWSRPARVDGESPWAGTADSGPVLKVVGQTACLLWMDGDRTFGETEELDDIAAAMGIGYAQFDLESGAFAQIRHFGAEGRLDMLPDVAEVGGRTVLAWLSTGDSITSVASADLWLAVCDGGEWTAGLAWEDLGQADSLSLADRGGRAAVCYARRVGEDQLPPAREEDASAAYDSELFQLKFAVEADGVSPVEGPVRLTENQVPDSSPAYSGGALFWLSGGVLQSDLFEPIPLPDCGGDYQLVSSPAHPQLYALVWAVPGRSAGTDGGPETVFYAVINEGAGWGQPVRVTTAGQVSGWSCQLNEEGDLLLAVNEQTVDAGYETVRADLRLYTVSRTGQLVLTGMDYESHTLIPGGQLKVYATVENQGLTASDCRFRCAFDGGAFQTCADGATLLPGECRTFSLTCPVPEAGADTLTLELDNGTSGQAVSWSYALGTQDLSVEQVSARLQGDGSVEVTAVVVNRGMRTSQAAAASVVRTASIGADGSQATEALAAQAIPTLEPQAFHLLTFTLPAERRVEAGELLYVWADAGEGAENLLSNDSGFAAVTALTAGGFSLDGTAAAVTGEGRVTVTLSALNEGESPVSGRVLAASYDASGGLVEAREAALALEAGEGLFQAVSLACPAGGSVRVFALDEACAPLCASFRWAAP